MAASGSSTAVERLGRVDRRVLPAGSLLEPEALAVVEQHRRRRPVDVEDEPGAGHQRCPLAFSLREVEGDLHAAAPAGVGGVLDGVACSARAGRWPRPAARAERRARGRRRGRRFAARRRSPVSRCRRRSAPTSLVSRCHSVVRSSLTAGHADEHDVAARRDHASAVGERVRGADAVEDDVGPAGELVADGERPGRATHGPRAARRARRRGRRRGRRASARCSGCLARDDQRLRRGVLSQWRR